MLIQLHKDKVCVTCGLKYMPVDWLKWRVEGYCQESCDPRTLEPAENDDQFELFGAEE